MCIHEVYFYVLSHVTNLKITKTNMSNKKVPLHVHVEALLNGEKLNAFFGVFFSIMIFK